MSKKHPERKQKGVVIDMDFLTGMAYWGIIVLVIINALIVSRMNVTFDDEDENNDE